MGDKMEENDYVNVKSEISAKLMEDITNIAFPRLVGTPGEKKAQDWVKGRIEEIGYEVHTEPVNASYFKLNQLTSFANILGAIFFILAPFLFQLYPPLCLIPLLLIFYAIYKISSASVEMGKPPRVPKFSKVFPTENIWAETPKTEGNLEGIVIGHYDSKSCLLNGIERVLCNLILLVCAIFFFGAAIYGIINFFINHSTPIILSNLLWGAGIGRVPRWLYFSI